MVWHLEERGFEELTAWFVRFLGMPAEMYVFRVEVSPARAKSKSLEARSRAAEGRDPTGLGAGGLIGAEGVGLTDEEGASVGSGLDVAGRPIVDLVRSLICYEMLDGARVAIRALAWQDKRR
jgi:hypothetical protein